MYVFRLWGFEIFTIGAKVKKKKKKTVGKAIEMKMGLKITLKWPDLGQQFW